MSHDANIKIIISCHKEISYPKSEIFLPVHVGAAQAKNKLVGMQPDNEGENISDRNFTYCELTAQYWAWKNLDADYYGQCHYRRYFYFGDGNYEANDHEQIEVDALSPRSLAELRLDDEALIRKKIEQYDLITAPRWCVKGVPTPDGPKNTIRDHMVAYGLVTNSDLEMLLDITKRIQPDYAEGLAAYLSGSEYLGYNCFIMKKQLFERLCEFEFSILSEFDANYAYEGLTTTHKRICGYFGEILFSVFVAQIEKEGKCEIGHAPLVFFEDTSPLFHADSLRLNDGNDAAIDIVWRYGDTSVIPFSVCIESLMRHLDPSTRYQLTIVHNTKFDSRELRGLISEPPSNLALRFATFPVMDCVPEDEELTEYEIDLMLPFLFASETYRALGGAAPRVLWVEGLAVFNRDPAEIVTIESDAPLLAMGGISLSRDLNKPYVAKDKPAKTTDFDTCLDQSVMVLDCASPLWCDSILLYREIESRLGYDAAAVLKHRMAEFKLHKSKPGTAGDCYCDSFEIRLIKAELLHSMGADRIPYEKVFPALSRSDTIAWACEDEAQEWSSVDSPVLRSYGGESSPLRNPSCKFCREYWAIARTSPAYEALLVVLTDRPSLQSRRVRDIVLPPGSFGRRALNKAARMVRGGE